MQVNRFDIPEFGEVVKRQTDVRDAAFLNPLTDICGIKIRQMTPVDLLALDGIDSPFIRVRPASREDFARFLRILSPLPYSYWRWRGNYRFGKACRKLNIADAGAAIEKYISVTFQDSPSGKATGQTDYASWCAHLVNWMAINYGWPMDEILSRPLRVLFQLQNCIKRYHDPNAIIHNPSDKVVSKNLALKQQRLNLVTLLAKRTRN
jgi:hypothetical protein